MAAAKPSADRVFHALGDPTRRAIVERLSRGPSSVSALAQPLAVTLTAVTQHLRVLEDSGLAHSEKLGRVRTARLGTAGLAALEHWIGELRARWQERLDNLGALLAEDE